MTGNVTSTRASPRGCSTAKNIRSGLSFPSTQDGEAPCEIIRHITTEKFPMVNP